MKLWLNQFYLPGMWWEGRQHNQQKEANSMLTDCQHLAFPLCVSPQYNPFPFAQPHPGAGSSPLDPTVIHCTFSLPDGHWPPISPQLSQHEYRGCSTRSRGRCIPTVTDAVAPGNIQAAVLTLQMNAHTSVVSLMTVLKDEEAWKWMHPAKKQRQMGSNLTKAPTPKQCT